MDDRGGEDKEMRVVVVVAADDRSSPEKLAGEKGGAKKIYRAIKATTCVSKVLTWAAIDDELLSIENAHVSRAYITSLSMSIAVRRWSGLSLNKVFTRALRRAWLPCASLKRISNSSVLYLTAVSSSVTLSLTPSKVVRAISINMSTISSHVSIIPYPAYSTLHLLRSDYVPSGAPVSIGLVVSSDGKGNGRDGTSSGGEVNAACLAMHASIDAAMGGSGLTVFRSL
nr:hypothetical protein [Tanacetum cinerariifolium]